MAPTYHGSCLCGEVAFEINANPIRVTCCHCKNCKKSTGTVFTTNVVFSTGSTSITKGLPHVSTYTDPKQDSGNALLCKFCSKCGTSLFADGGDFGRTVSVLYSALDDFNVVDPADGSVKEAKPEIEYYSKDRIWWVRPIEGAEHPRTKPGRND